MIYRLIIFANLVLIILFTSCNNPADTYHQGVELVKIEKSIDSCIGWFKDKDFDLLFSVVAHDSNFLSVHPTNKIVRGYEEFLKNEANQQSSR